MKVKFYGCSDAQANWGSGSDPRKYLTQGQEYEVEKEEVHSWHTLLFLKGIEGSKGFNSACFQE